MKLTRVGIIVTVKLAGNQDSYAPPLFPSLLTSTLLPPCSFTFTVPWLSLIPPSVSEREDSGPSLAEVDCGHIAQTTGGPGVQPLLCLQLLCDLRQTLPSEP